jgi:hypothetical protein
MGRKRTAAAEVEEIAKAAVLQGLLLVLGIWFTLPFRETITIGRKRVSIRCHHRPPPGRSRGSPDTPQELSSGRSALFGPPTQKKAPARRRG